MIGGEDAAQVALITALMERFPRRAAKGGLEICRGEAAAAPQPAQAALI